MTDSSKYFEQLEDAVDSIVAKDLDAAIEFCNEAISAAPDRAEGYAILGLVAMQMEDAGRAVELLERAHQMDQGCQDYTDALAVIYAKAGKLADSLYYAKLSLTLEPHPELRQIIPAVFRNYQDALNTATPSPHYVNGVINFNMHEYEKAVDSCHKELRINDRHAACYVVLARSYAALGKFEHAVDACHAAVHIDLTTPKLYECLGDSLIRLGRFDEGIACKQEALSLAPDDYRLAADVLASLAYSPDGKWRDAADELNELNKLVGADAEQIDLADLPADPDKKKIRIGYVSDGFWDSPVSQFLEAAFEGHDKSRFEVYGYQQNNYQDTTTTRFKSLADKWLSIFDLDDDTAANIISRDSVDILVDACGNAEGRSLALFARRAAGVQVGWLGWPRGEGLDTIDFQLTDAVTSNNEEAFPGGAKRVPLDSGLVAFNAGSVAMDVEKLRVFPAFEAGLITFGGICDLARLTPSVVRAWSGVLHAVPASRLLLGYVGFVSLAVKARAKELFSHFGLIDRVTFQVTPPEVSAQHVFFSQVDIFLDTFPVSAAVETCEAMLVGIPVVTIEAARKTAVSSASILHAAGKAEWAAPTEEAFIQIAAGLAANPTGLSEQRTSLPKDMANSALCDRRAFAQAMEAAFLQMLKARVSD
ncbi:MAG: hypothetical protein HN403_06450 [Rhodospirillales bacterium]|jgi:protein O-GlcNAc transferase|nr:hypothetical protein [Rhodospirillales bacterium]